MNKKIIGILVCILLVISSVTTVTAEFNNDNEKQIFRYYENYYPDDFELIIESGGFAPWTKLFQIYVTTSGFANYSITYEKDRGTGDWTLIEEFQFTQSEMEQIWNKIVENNFFDLNDLYSEDVEDGTFAYMKITANGETHEVTTENFEVLKFDNIVKKINDFTPGYLDMFYNSIYNDAPKKPMKPSGSPSGKPNIEYTYTTSTIDYEGENLFYWFDWGDGSNSGWIGPYDSGNTASAKHKWNSQSNYSIKVKAKDDPNGDGNHSDGKESRLSDPLPISIPKNRQFSNNFLEILFQNFFYFFPFLEKIKILNEKVTSSELTFKTLSYKNILSYPESGTEVTIKECNITITLKIEIYGEGADEYLVEQIQSEIEHVWGTNLVGGNWYIDCKEKDKTCPRLKPGCKIIFNITVKKRNATDTPRSGFHQVNVSNDTSADGQGSYSTATITTPNGGTGTGNWDNNENPGTYAHEAGHLMGLPDLYIEGKDENGKRQTKPRIPEYDDHIMANVTGWPTANNISEIVNSGGVYCPCDCCPPEEDNEDPDTNIQTPQNNQHVSNPIIIGGYADDGLDGSGIALLDYLLQWNSGNYDGPDYPVDPPQQIILFELGPIDLSYYIQPGDLITITVFATDAVGNTGFDTVTVTWVEDEDNTPPVTEKTIGEPNENGGYIIWPFTPITFEATDDMSGVKYIYYEVWWDSNEDGIVDMLMAEKTVYDNFVMFSVDMYGILINTIELRWYAVDNADNTEDMHFQQHYVTP